jgi:pyrophosphatase PpaX
MTAGPGIESALRRVRYILFDLDGTLIDTIPLIIKTFRETLRALGLPDRSDAQLLSQVGRPLHLQVADIDRERAQELFDTYQRLYREFRHEMPRDFDGTRDVIAELKRRGYPMAVVTSKRLAGTVRDLEYSGLAPFFDAIVSAEETEKHKPAAEPVLEALKRLGAPAEEATYIGDSPFDIRSAHAAGVLAGAVKWTPFERSVLEAELPDYWVENPQSLLDMFPRPPRPR